MGAIVQKYWDDRIWHITIPYGPYLLNNRLLSYYFFCPGRRRQCQFQFGFIAVKLEISIELNLIRSDDFQTEFKVATAEAKHSFDLLIKYSFTAHNKKFALNSQKNALKQFLKLEVWECIS